MVQSRDSDPADRSVCCLCMRSFFKRFDLYVWIVAANILVSIAGMVCNLIYFAGSFQSAFLYAGIALHCFSFLVDLLLTTYPFRFWNGMEGKNADRNRGSACCCFFRFAEYSYKTYVLISVHFFAIVIMFANIGWRTAAMTWAKDRAYIVSTANITLLGIIMYYTTFCICILWTLVRRPLTDDSTNTFYFQDSDRNIDSGTSLAVLAVSGFIVANANLGVYYTDPLIRYILLGASNAMLVGACIAYCILQYKHYASENSKFTWTMVTIGSCVSSIACFIYALVGQVIVPEFQHETYVLWIALLAQGALPLLAIAICGIVLIVYCFSACITGCKTAIQESVREADTQVNEKTKLVMN